MIRIRVMLAMLLALCLPLLLAGCGSDASQPAVSEPTATQPPASQSPMDQATTIKLAKAAATKLSSPPRIYAIGGSYVQRWPDAVGAITTTYAVCGAQPAAMAGGNPGAGDPCQKLMTLTTQIALAPNGTSQNVTFLATWQPDNARESKHSWQFTVGTDQQVKFISEDGDPLPPMVQ